MSAAWLTVRAAEELQWDWKWNGTAFASDGRNKGLKSKKEELLGYFRYRSREILSELEVQYAARDFKSSFGSNEKGNTNRLLLVGSVHNYIETESYQCALLVRCVENEGQ